MERSGKRVLRGRFLKIAALQAVSFEKGAIILMDPGVEEIHRLCPSSVGSSGLRSDSKPSKEEDGWKPW